MEADPVDLALALHWVGDDRGLLVELVGIFVAEAPTRLAELRDAAVTGDAATLERVAHSLKGSAGILGASGLRAASAALEECALTKRVEGAPEFLGRIERELGRVLAFFHDPAWPGKAHLEGAP